MAKILGTQVPEPVEVTHHIEITQNELDFIVRAARALGQQGYYMSRSDSDNSYLQNEFKSAAASVVKGLESEESSALNRKVFKSYQ